MIKIDVCNEFNKHVKKSYFWAVIWKNNNNFVILQSELLLVTNEVINY